MLEKNGLSHISGFFMVRLMHRALMRFKIPRRLRTHKVFMTAVLAQALAGTHRYCFITAVHRTWDGSYHYFIVSWQTPVSLRTCRKTEQIFGLHKNFWDTKM